MPRVGVAAVQVAADLDDFRSFGAFETLVRAALQPVLVDRDETVDGDLVVFPEHLGFLLSMVPFHGKAAADASDFQTFVRKAAGDRDPRELLQDRAVEVAEFYDDLFSSIASTHGVYVVNGSITLPPMDDSPHRSGRRVIDDERLLNTSSLFGPSGRCLLRTAKVRVPAGEDSFVDPAPLQELCPAATSIGRIGTVLCFDGYHHGPIERLDAQGTEILTQPIHFPSPDLRYDGSGKRVPEHEAFGHLLQGRENIRIGVAAALVGETFRDRRAEGRSTIVANHGRPGADWADIALAEADRTFAGEVLSATVEL